MGEGTYTFPGPVLSTLDHIARGQADMLTTLKRIALISELAGLHHTIERYERAIGSRLPTDHKFSMRRREIEWTLWPSPERP